MKKILMLLLCVSAIVFCSCSSEEYSETSVHNNNVSQADVVELSAVQLQIDSLNQNLFPNTANYQTRGLGKFFKKFFAIVVCDAVGGMFGSLYGGPVGAASGAILASGVAAFTHTELHTSSNRSSLRAINTDTTALSPSVIPITVKNGTQPSKNDSIGYFHNKTLSELNYSMVSERKTIDNLTVKVAEATASNYNVAKDTIVTYLNTNSELFENIRNVKLYETSEDDNIHVLINKWKGLYPEQSGQFDVLESFFNGISNLEVSDNDGTYLNNVLNIIESSSLNPEVKENVRNAFIVGNASYQLWNTEE